MEDFFEPSTTQMVADRTPQKNGQCRTGSLARRISCLLSFSLSQLIHITVCILLLFRALSMIASTIHWETSHGLTSNVRSSISITDLVTQRLTRIELAAF